LGSYVIFVQNLSTQTVLLRSMKSPLHYFWYLYLF
jgi:hypothetical protein